MVEVFREVHRVLRDDGTVWLNLGDSYATGAGLKPKDLIGIPWRVAFALQADGWYLRQDIIWSKPNPMPESVTDRCTKAHEYVFLLSKSARYYYDADAIAEAVEYGENRATFLGGTERLRKANLCSGGLQPSDKGMDRQSVSTRNKRSVWEVATAPFSEAHFATFPPALIEPCILAGCPKGGTVLDHFGGAGTTGLVADRLGRDAVLIELNPEYAAMAERRIREDAGMFANVVTV
jgi:DNA modification methylase